MVIKKNSLSIFVGQLLQFLYLFDLFRELTLSLETTLQLIEGEPVAQTPNSTEELIQRILDVCRGRGGLPDHLRGKVWFFFLRV